MSSSNDTLVHDLDGDSAIIEFDNPNYFIECMKAASDVLVEAKKCHFCSKDATGPDGKLHYVPFTDAAICVVCANLLKDTNIRCDCGLPLTRGYCTGHCDNDE